MKRLQFSCSMWDEASALPPFLGAYSQPVYYTEWSSSSDPKDYLHDEPYTAAVIVKTTREANGLVHGYSFWTFTDIFEENYMPATAFQGGFGLLTLQGIPKPSFRAFELLHRLGAEALAVTGEHDTVDVWVVRGPDAVTVLLTNHVPAHAIAAVTVELTSRRGHEQAGDSGASRRLASERGK